MAAPVPTSFPTSLRAGDSAAFTITVADYSSADYTLTLRIVGPGGVLSSTATASGTAFAFVLTSAETATLAPGDYSISAQATATGEAVTVFTSRLSVLPNLATADATTETRSYWRIYLTDIKAALAVFGSDPTQAYTIMGERAVTLKTMDDFHRAYAFAQSQVNAEDAANGNGGSKNILMRFRNAR